MRTTNNINLLRSQSGNEARKRQVANHAGW